MTFDPTPCYLIYYNTDLWPNTMLFGRPQHCDLWPNTMLFGRPQHCDLWPNTMLFGRPQHCDLWPNIMLFSRPQPVICFKLSCDSNILFLYRFEFAILWIWTLLNVAYFRWSQIYEIHNKWYLNIISLAVKNVLDCQKEIKTTAVSGMTNNNYGNIWKLTKIGS